MRRYMIVQEALSSDLQLSISRSCSALEVNRSGYCKWRKEQDASASESSEDMVLRDEIQGIALEFPGYGYQRITAELQNRGYAVNHKHVLRLMRLDNLLSLKKKLKPVTTDSSHNLPVYPNLLKDTKITGLNQVWAADIIYVQLLHCRKCIGWELGRNPGRHLAMNALAKALQIRWSESLTGLIHHSDRGVQSTQNR